MAGSRPLSTTETIARHRSAQGVGSKTHTPHVKQADLVGAAGELIFARYIGVDPFTVDRGAPDSGWDFTVGGYKIDVKGTDFQPRFKISLIVDVGQVKADLYVLVHVDDAIDARGTIMGWATAAEVSAAPLKVSGLGKRVGYDLTGHAINWRKLRPLETLPFPKLEAKPRQRKPPPGVRVETQEDYLIDGLTSIVLYRSKAGECETVTGLAGDVGFYLYNTPQHHNLDLPWIWYISGLDHKPWPTLEVALHEAFHWAVSTSQPIPPHLITTKQSGLDFG
jgi:hypothetical protein